MVSITIHTAAARNEPRGHGGYAAIIEMPTGAPIAVRGSQMGAQLDRMELTGAAAALVTLIRETTTRMNTGRMEVEIHTDSPWLVQTFNNPRAQERGPLTEYWKSLMDLTARRPQMVLTFIQEEPGAEGMKTCLAMAHEETLRLGNAEDGEYSFRMTPGWDDPQNTE